MKSILLFFGITLAITGSAQVTKVALRASGLTCSMCSNSINKALGRLDFVERIDANLKTYTFEIYFKINSVVDFGKIRKKVEDAGFSVSSFVATIHFNNVQLKDNQPVIVGSNAILFLNLKEQALDGEKQVKLLDKGFVSSVESKRMSLPVLSPGNYHGTI